MLTSSKSTFCLIKTPSKLQQQRVVVCGSLKVSVWPIKKQRQQLTGHNFQSFPCLPRQHLLGSHRGSHLSTSSSHRHSNRDSSSRSHDGGYIDSGELMGWCGGGDVEHKLTQDESAFGLQDFCSKFAEIRIIVQNIENIHQNIIVT